jgi:hypothetical protein
MSSLEADNNYISETIIDLLHALAQNQAFIKISIFMF